MGKFVSINATNAYSGNGGMAPLGFLTLVVKVAPRRLGEQQRITTVGEVREEERERS